MYLPLIASCLLLTANGIIAEESSDYHKCLENDSISCIQMTMFRQAKSFFDQPNIDIFGGLSLKKTEETRQGKSIEDNTISVESAKSVEERNNEIENYFMTNAKNFFKERSLTINFAEAANSIAKKIPDDIKSDLKDLVVEGRTKRRKIMRKMMLIMYGLKFKFLLLGLASLFGLLLIAKKALLTSIVALGLALFSGFAGIAGRTGGFGGGGGGGGFLSSLGLGHLFGGGSNTGYSNGGGGWAHSGGWHSGGGGGGGNAGWHSGGGGYGGGGWDSHGSYSSPVAQSIAYSGHQQAR